MTRQQIKIGLWVLAGLLWLAGLEIRGWGQQITLGTQTKGVLPLNQGGTNATDAAAARANIGAVGLSDSQTLSNKIITSPRVNDIRGYSNSLMTVLFGEAVGAANYVGIYQAAPGSGPLIQALGTDANVDLRLRPQGSGALDLGAMTAIKITGCAAGDYLRIAGGNLASCDSGSGSGAPTAASYITRTAEAGLSNETALDSLSTGLLKNTAGVLSAATASDLPNHASRHNNGGADQIGIDGGQVISGLVVDARIPTSLAGRTFTSGVTINDGGTGTQSFLKLVGVSSEPACVAGSSILYSVAGELDYCNGFTMTRAPVGNVLAIGVITAGHVAYFASATNIQSYLAPATAATPSTFAIRGSQGDLKAQQFEGVPTNDNVAGIFQRYNSSQTNYILEIRREDTARMAGVDKNFNWVGNVIGNITGNAATANALTSDPTDCPATGFAYQINSAGALTCRAVSLATADTTGQLAVNRLNVTGTPDSSKVLYGDRWAAPPSGGGNLGWYNVKDSPYNAAGDGVNDDTAEIQAAITACETSSRGGIVYFPYGIYGISAGLWHGNGSSSGLSNPSTTAVCRFVGQGPGDSSFSTGGANVQVSAIKWIGSNPGSPGFMLTIDGPMFGWGMEDLQLWANSNTNLYGLDARHINYSHMKNVAIMDTGGGSGGGFAMKIWPQKTFTQFACFNTIENLRIRVATGLAGSALWVGGNSTYGTACSINMVGGYLNRDNNYTSGTNTATYSLLLDSSDNFHAAFTHFSDTGGNGLRNGCSIGAAVGAYTGAGVGVYPDSAHFYGISSGGMCGTTGSGRPFVVWGGECGAGGQGSCDYHNAFTGGGTKPIALSGESGKELKGLGQMVTSYTSNDPDYADVVINHASGGQNGSGNVYFQRTGVNIARINTDYFTGMRLLTGNGTGSGTLYERLQLKTDGRIQINFVDRATINSMTAEQWDMIGCSDCQRDTSCTAGGTGALAKAITNGTGIANWVCN